MPDDSNKPTRYGPFAPGTILERCDVPDFSLVATVMGPDGWPLGHREGRPITYRVMTAQEIEERNRSLEEASLDRFRDAAGRLPFRNFRELKRARIRHMQGEDDL